MKKIMMAMLGIVMALSIVGCASSTIPVRKAEMSFDSEQPLKNTLDAITYVLNNHSFEIDNVNESYGIVYTKWKKINYSNTGMTIFAAATTGTAAKYSRYVKLDFKASENGYTVSPREKNVNVINKFAQQSTTEVEVELKLDSNEGKDIQKIVDEINDLLGIKGTVEWKIYDNVVQ